MVGEASWARAAGGASNASGLPMRDDPLQVRARLRVHARAVLADLRYYGVADSNIQACRTLPELDELLARTLAWLMCQRDPRAAFSDPRKQRAAPAT